MLLAASLAFLLSEQLKLNTALLTDLTLLLDLSVLLVTSSRLDWLRCTKYHTA